MSNKPLTSPVVGQTIFGLNVGNAARHTPQVLSPWEVLAVGRKYFTAKPAGCGDWQKETFYLDTWRQKSDYYATVALYASQQEYEDEKEQLRKSRRIALLFDRQTGSKVPLDVLRQVEVLLEPYLPMPISHNT